MRLGGLSLTIAFARLTKLGSLFNIPAHMPSNFTSTPSLALWTLDGHPKRNRFSVWRYEFHRAIQHVCVPHAHMLERAMNA